MTVKNLKTRKLRGGVKVSTAKGKGYAICTVEIPRELLPKEVKARYMRGYRKEVKSRLNREALSLWDGKGELEVVGSHVTVGRNTPGKRKGYKGRVKKPVKCPVCLKEHKEYERVSKYSKAGIMACRRCRGLKEKYRGSVGYKLSEDKIGFLREKL